MDLGTNAKATETENGKVLLKSLALKSKFSVLKLFTLKWLILCFVSLKIFFKCMRWFYGCMCVYICIYVCVCIHNSFIVALGNSSKSKDKKTYRDFPGGPVVKTTGSQCRHAATKKIPYRATKTWHSQIN